MVRSRVNVGDHPERSAHLLDGDLDPERSRYDPRFEQHVRGKARTPTLVFSKPGPCAGDFYTQLPLQN